MASTASSRWCATRWSGRRWRIPDIGVGEPSGYRGAHSDVLPAKEGGSSTLRLLGSIIDASGILDRPLSRTMTIGYEAAISRHLSSEVCYLLCRPPIKGRREDRVLAAPAVSRAICANKTAHEHTGQREHSGLPCAMALRLTSCSPRRTALLPPLSLRSFASPERNASTATSEPHDFTVRVRAYVYRAICVHRISPRVRDDGQRPSSAVRRAELCR